MQRIPILLSGLLFAGVLLIFSACDNCKDITCENDGSCDDGECECPQHYLGDNCELQESPTHIKIKKVTFTGLQQILSKDWDTEADGDNKAADVSMVIGKHSVEGDWFTSGEVYQNTRASSLTFFKDLPITYEGAETLISFALFNISIDSLDEGNYDGLYWVHSKLYDDQNDFNETLFLSNGYTNGAVEDAAITVEVEVEYVFD